MDRIFNGNEHLQTFTEVINKMKYSDVYHKSIAYLLTLDTVTRKHINDIFDFKEDCIKPESLKKPWQTSASRKTTRFAFNLWNGCCSDGETYTDEDGYTRELPSRHFTVDDIFCCQYAPYYWQALRIRFPESCAEMKRRIMMKYKFRIEITLNEEKIISDGKYDINDLYQRILNFAKVQHITQLKSKDKKILHFGKTGELKDDFADCWIFQTALLDCGWFKEYAESMKWYNDFENSDHPENVLEEYYNFDIKGM